MRHLDRRQTLHCASMIAMLLAIFLIDLRLPLGVAFGVPYVLPVLLSYWSSRPKYIFIIAISGSVLTALGFLLSPPGGELWKVLLNRFLALMAIWVTAVALARYKSGEAELKRARDELLAANRELEAFSYSVSHDLRAPLRAADGFSKMLLEDYSGKLDDEGKRYVERIRAACQKMGALIDDLLKLSRVTRHEMIREPVNLSKAAEDIVNGLRSGDSGRSVDVYIQQGLVAQGDPKLLRIALENLIANAWKFTAKKGKARIEFGMEAVNGAPAYFVRDDGAGFYPKYGHKLFTAFQRLHSPADFEGTGIGLATVKRVITRHGGDIWAEGDVDKGAVFYFTIR